MTPDLLPCPFCGGKGIPQLSAEMPFVYCESCESNGPECDSHLSAVTWWNIRADPTPHHAAQLLLSYLDNDKRQSIDPSGHCVKLIHGLRAIAEENK